MLKEPIPSLQGKNIALVAMGQSQIDYHLSRTHSLAFDEIWAVNAMIGVLPEIDRAFILDPMFRFLDTEDAGSMTQMMRKYLPQAKYPVYTCELDERVPYAEEFPLEPLIKDLGCSLCYSFCIMESSQSFNCFWRRFYIQNKYAFCRIRKSLL